MTAWFIKAGEYVQTGRARIGFVATNSITQGEQVAQLWPILFARANLAIAFAHRTFAWGSDARGKAHVHVVIIGLDDLENTQADKRLFSYPDINGEPEETLHAALSPYLFDAGGLADPHLTVREESRPINGMVHLKTGVQMIDDGILTFSEQDKDEFLYKEPGAAQFFRRYIGGDEYINGFHRWILYLRDANPAHLKKLPLVKELVSKVRRYRSSSQRASTRRMADYPTQVGVDERLDQDYLVIPNTSSERREYVPIGWLGPEVIATRRAEPVCPHVRSLGLEIAHSSGRHSCRFFSSHLRHAHGLDADGDGAHEERLGHVFHRRRLQHLSAAAREFRLVETGSRSRKPCSTPALPIRTLRWPISTIPI